jgi:hypothetical protein
VVSQKAIFLPDEHPGMLPPLRFIPCFLLLSFLQDCEDEDTPKSRQQIAFFLPADAAFLLGYILYYQRSLCFPVYY